MPWSELKTLGETMMCTNRIKFLNTYIDSLTTEEATHVVDNYIQDRGIHYVVTPNTDIIVKMQKDAELKDACNHADLILTDGQMLVKLSKWLGNQIKERICMTDFVWNICRLAEERDYRLFLFGGKPEILEKGRKVILKRHPWLNIVGCCSIAYRFEKNEQQIHNYTDMMQSSNPDILLAFLGCPKLEKFIYHYKDQYQVPVSITMGGCIDLIAESVKRAPKWMQDIGLECFFRFFAGTTEIISALFHRRCFHFQTCYAE